MKLNREATRFGYFLVVFCLVKAIEEEGENEETHENLPRTFQFFSRPKPPDNERISGFRPLTHAQNAFSGGSIGFSFELNPLKKVHDIVELGKKKIGFFLGPDKSRSPNEPDRKAIPDKGHEDYESGELARPQEDDSPEDGIPNWEDIGEEDAGTTIPIEQIIQPRRKNRPRRYIQSKIYRVHLNFTSNAKPYQMNGMHIEQKFLENNA